MIPTTLPRVRALLLALLASAACAPLAQSGDPTPVGSVWEWQETLASSGTRVVAAAPERYTIEFLPDGALRVQADCNRGSGRYETGAGRRLAIGPIATTKKMCPPGTQDAEFLRGLASAVGYRFDGADLVLLPATGDGSMRFRAAAR